MTMSSLLDAYDTVAHSEVLLQRLGSAFAELSRKQGLNDEKAWLSQAIDRVTAARTGVGDLLSRVMRLPEMEPAREDHARSLQQLAVDAVERLQAGITFHAGSRAPLLEALFGKLKLPLLRRADREDFEKFCVDFDKRLSSTYAKRMLGESSLSLVVPAVEAVRASFVTWREAFSGEPLEETAARALRDELDACARTLELPLRQARLLAEAALAPLKDLFDETGLSQKPKKRSLRPVVTEADGEAVPEAEEPEAEEPAPPAPVAPKRRARAES
jgi:hypothetical protein